jgi:shikimate dehydrogenase
MNRLAVLGYPVGHSRSPAMQTAALAELGLGDEWSYEAIEVAPDVFERRVRAMAGEGFVGANVTVPHKGAALALADELSETAREVGAANTLVFSHNGESGEADEVVVRAENTDPEGLLRSLPGTPRDRRALVLGAGGAARAVVWALLREGAHVDVWNRTALRSQHLCEELGGTPVTAPDPTGYELIVNTTAVGLAGEDPFAELPLSQDGFAAEQTVVDMVYGGEPTTLLRAAAEVGATTVDGIEILVQQGALSLEIWTGRPAPLDTMRAAARG